MFWRRNTTYPPISLIKEGIRGCGSEIELFRFEVALWHDRIKIHGRAIGLMQPETFPEHPFDTIPHDCRSDFLTAIPTPRIGMHETNKHNEVFGKTATLITNRGGIGPPEQSMPTRPG